MATIFPIAAGKGGVGKSFIAANLAALLARRGRRVVLIDLDLGAANLHTLLGMRSDGGGLERFLAKATDQLDRVAVPTPLPNLLFISSANCAMEIANLYHAQKIKLINAIRRLPADYVVLDLGAGTHFNTLDFFLTALNGVLVCVPEHTSIENAFRFIKAAYLRRLKQIINHNAFSSAIKNAVENDSGAGLGAADIVELVLKYNPKQEMALRKAIARFQFHLILNQVRRNTDSTLGEKIVTACNRHFHSPFDYLGSIDLDERVLDAVAARKLLVALYPEAKTTRDLKHITDRLTIVHHPSEQP